MRLRKRHSLWVCLLLPFIKYLTFVQHVLLVQAERVSLSYRKLGRFLYCMRIAVTQNEDKEIQHCWTCIGNLLRKEKGNTQLAADEDAIGSPGDLRG
jgi:hypothetical protein